MIRTFFAALGVLFALLLVFCASFLGNLAFEQHQQGPAYETLAVDITRDLARTWSLDDIKSRYVGLVARNLVGGAAQRPFDALRPLGPLRYADNLQHQTRWTRAALRALKSPAAGAELLADLLSKTVTVTFLAKFANGFADVTAVLKSEGGKMKLWHLQIDSRGALPSAPPAQPQAISHA